MFLRVRLYTGVLYFVVTRYCISELDHSSTLNKAKVLQRLHGRKKNRFRRQRSPRDGRKAALVGITGTLIAVASGPAGTAEPFEF